MTHLATYVFPSLSQTHRKHQLTTPSHQPQSFASSVKNFVTANIASATASAPASALSRAASAQSALVAFAKTASVSIPSAVTEVKGLETFTSVPAWYSALPSDVKSYYDENNSKVQALVNQAILGTAAPSGSAQPSATGSAGAKSTGAASSERVVQYVGAGVAAGFAGLMAL